MNKIAALNLKRHLQDSRTYLEYLQHTSERDNPEVAKFLKERGIDDAITRASLAQKLMENKEDE